MGPKEKYNIIVNKIEELVQGECIDGIIMGMDELEICEKAFDAAQSIMDIRSQNILFGFLMDKRIKTYVQERKMMAAYKAPAPLPRSTPVRLRSSVLPPLS